MGKKRKKKRKLRVISSNYIPPKKKQDPSFLETQKNEDWKTSKQTKKQTDKKRK